MTLLFLPAALYLSSDGNLEERGESSLQNEAFIFVGVCYGGRVPKQHHHSSKLMLYNAMALETVYKTMAQANTKKKL